ncbi:hypothetical protein KGF54_005387 [Candida jiufengensis]|uniref:uncharacterized protein n=1 Tax=Candida jiufengensis TaxID=497108 RepID=UPI0022242F95|nr:uncharacterized protein KGF54_005387 [Candida jiufengensis]KAI5949909.1 hypothetical protein KGF54_005387 [Candida jiufengensis]
MEHPQVYLDSKIYDQEHNDHDQLTIIGGISNDQSIDNNNINNTTNNNNTNTIINNANNNKQNNNDNQINNDKQSKNKLKQDDNRSHSDNELNQLYNQLKKLYDENNFMQIMFLLPKIGKMELIPPVFHLIIGCSMIHFGRNSSAFRELGFAIYMAPTEQKRKDFLKVLAFTYADLKMTNDALSCIGEYLDLSRQNLITPQDLDNMKNDVEELNNLVMDRVEQSKMNNQQVIKIQSIEDQIMNIPSNYAIPSNTFLGKCQYIIQKITQCEKLLQQNQRDKFNHIIKNIILSIFTFGPTESYLQLLKMEPNFNKYCESFIIQPKRKVSVFQRSTSHKEVNNNNQFNNNSSIGSNNNYNIPMLMEQIKIIKGFISMLRHEYKEAFNFFNEFEIDNNQNNDDYKYKVLFLKYICQSKLIYQNKKDYELIYEKIAKIPINISIKYKTMGEISQKIYEIEINLSKTKKLLLKNSSINYHDLALKCYLSSVALLDEDDLYIGEHYDLILNFLVKYDVKNLRVISFFYQVRNLFVLISDYNYLHQPDLVCDWNEIKTNNKLLNSIENYLETNQFISDNQDLNFNNLKSNLKQFDPINYWIKEYKKFKNESDLKIETICKIVGYPDPN